MNRTAIRCLLLAVAIPLLVSGMAVAAENRPQPIAVEQTSQLPPAPAPQAAQQEPAAPACTASASTPASALLETPDGALPACSPPPLCWTDRDCDRICGRGNGQCIQVNSCYRECACFSSTTTSPPRP